MRTIKASSRFRKDVERESGGANRGVIAEELPVLLDLLVRDAALPASARDHVLTGNKIGYRDCHIRPDLVLIYKKPDDEWLYLVRLGSQSELGL
jgi:mRNA interferase YafQ